MCVHVCMCVPVRVRACVVRVCVCACACACVFGGGASTRLLSSISPHLLLCNMHVFNSFLFYLLYGTSLLKALNFLH